MVIMVGIKAPIQYGVRIIIIKLDCLNVILAIQQYPNCLYDFSSICYEIHRIIKSMNNVCIYKCTRSSVRQAHNLAVEARRYGVYIVYVCLCCQKIENV